MGYRIVYASKKRQTSSCRLLTAAFFAVFAILVHIFWPDGVAILKAILAPDALETFVQILENGDSLADAVAAFGQDVTHVP